MSNPPVTSSAGAVTLLEQQLADVIAEKSACLAELATVRAAGLGPTYTISGRNGSETLDAVGYRRYLMDSVKSLTELERFLLEALQDLQPFTVTRRVHIATLAPPRPWMGWIR